MKYVAILNFRFEQSDPWKLNAKFKKKKLLLTIKELFNKLNWHHHFSSLEWDSFFSALQNEQKKIASNTAYSSLAKWFQYRS